MIGAGTMGGGIAMNFANAGIPVTMVETAQDALDRGLGVDPEELREHGRSAAGSRRRRSRSAWALSPARSTSTTSPTPTSSSRRCSRTWTIKKEVFAKLDGIAKPGAILATNTSDPRRGRDRRRDQAAASDVIGMHFFSPANVMRLLEVVRGEEDRQGRARHRDGGRRADRQGRRCVVGVCHGFVGNRMLAQRGREAETLILEGALPQEVDAVLTEFGFPMGPFAMGDLAGLDIGWRIRKERGKRDDDRATRSASWAGFGQKTGAGYLRYEAARARRSPIRRSRRSSSTPRSGSASSARDDRRRGDPGAAGLPDDQRGREDPRGGHRRSAPRDIDVVWIYGYGWPVCRGGPMFYADQIGLDLPARPPRRLCGPLGQQGARAGAAADPARPRRPGLRREGERGQGGVSPP